MSAFAHFIVLLSFFSALALTHLLSRMAGMLFARDRVRFSGLLFAWMLNAMAWIFINWLSLWDAHGIRVWSLYSIALQFLFAVSQFFLCAMAAPEYPAEGPIDMEALYWRARVPLYGLLLAASLLAIIGNVDMMQVNATLFFRQNILTLASIPTMVLALTVRARWAQWVGVLCALTFAMIFLALFETALR